MTESIIGLVLALALMGVGVIGSILPGLPGSPLVLVAAVLHRLYFGEQRGASLWVLGLLTLMVLLSLVIDYLATLYGAKKMGATWKGLAGALVGALIGMFFNIPGIIIGTFIGALAFELAGGRERNEALKAGVGATIGLLAGTAGKVAVCVSMTALFTVHVVYRTWFQ
jgi:uncharacterized protein YqgC (DUF456 family)